MRAAWGRPNACVLEGNKQGGSLGLGLRYPDSSIPRIFPSPHGLQLVPTLDGCLHRDDWLDQQAQTSASVPTSLRSCAVESQPGIFFPQGLVQNSVSKVKVILPSMASSVSISLQH